MQFFINEKSFFKTLLSTIQKILFFSSKNLLIFFVSIIFNLIVCNSSFALESYYGDLDPTSQDNQFRNQLFRVLSQVHIVQPGTPDKIVASCPQGANCIQHRPIGYDGARRQIFGRLYLINNQGQYSVPDVYCDDILTSQNFPYGRGPGPGQIPATTVANVEHSWPQSKFSNQFSKDLQKSDLNILFPVSSQANSLRSNYSYGDVSTVKGQVCPASELGYSSDNSRQLKFTPPANIRGNVARAKFYFAVRYQMRIDAEEEDTLKRWNHEDPVDEDERSIADAIYELQKDRNPFVDHPEWIDLIADF
ncbi:MAG: endonuclease [Bdellovibrionales bacterium]|nr:endonuclease [Bdellovibrionales bacterium]